MNFYLDLEYPSESAPEMCESGSEQALCIIKNDSSKPPAPQPSRRPRKSKKSRSICYNWNTSQNRKYINFLLKHRELFQLSSQQRKNVKINVLMSETIKTRSAAQCHSHHQKMMLKYLSFDNIIRSNQSLITYRILPKYLLQQLKQILSTNQSSHGKQNCGEKNGQNQTKTVETRVDEAEMREDQSQPHGAQSIGAYLNQ